MNQLTKTFLQWERGERSDTEMLNEIVSMQVSCASLLSDMAKLIEKRQDKKAKE